MYLPPKHSTGSQAGRHEEGILRTTSSSSNSYSLSAPNLEPVMSPDFSTCMTQQLLSLSCRRVWLAKPQKLQGQSDSGNGTSSCTDAERVAATCLVRKEAQLSRHVITALHLHIPRCGWKHALKPVRW